MIKFFQRFATLRWLLPDRDVKQSYHPKNKNYALFLGYVSVVLKKFLRYNILHPPSFCCHESSNKFFQRSFHRPIAYTPLFQRNTLQSSSLSLAISKRSWRAYTNSLFPIPLCHSIIRTYCAKKKKGLRRPNARSKQCILFLSPLIPQRVRDSLSLPLSRPYTVFLYYSYYHEIIGFPLCGFFFYSLSLSLFLKYE